MLYILLQGYPDTCHVLLLQLTTAFRQQLDCVLIIGVLIVILGEYCTKEVANTLESERYSGSKAWVYSQSDNLNMYNNDTRMNRPCTTSANDVVFFFEEANMSPTVNNWQYNCDNFQKQFSPIWECSSLTMSLLLDSVAQEVLGPLVLNLQANTRPSKTDHQYIQLPYLQCIITCFKFMCWRLLFQLLGLHLKSYPIPCLAPSLKSLSHGFKTI
jgi:hypothetical protein